MSDPNPYAPPPGYQPQPIGQTGAPGPDSYHGSIYPTPAPTPFWTTGKVILFVVLAVLAVFGALAIVGLIASVANDDAARSSTSTTTTTPPIANTASEREDAYIALVRDQLNLTQSDISDSEIIETAQVMCEAKRAGFSEDRLVSMAMDADFSAFNAGYFVRASLTTFCPSA